MEPIDFKDVDFFGCRFLNHKEARFCVRSGKIFFYCENVRFDIGNDPASLPADVDLAIPGDKIEASNLDLTKDVTIHGFLWFWQQEDTYVLAMIDPTKKHNPVVLRCGNVLKELDKNERRS